MDDLVSGVLMGSYHSGGGGGPLIGGAMKHGLGFPWSGAVFAAVFAIQVGLLQALLPGRCRRGPGAMHGACSALCGASDAYQVVENLLGAEMSESPGLERCLPPSLPHRWAFGRALLPGLCKRGPGARLQCVAHASELHMPLSMLASLMKACWRESGQVNKGVPLHAGSGYSYSGVRDAARAEV